jgi:hypothetical protein
MTQCSFCGVDSYDLIKDYLKEKNLKEENLTRDEMVEISREVDFMIYLNCEYDISTCQNSKCNDKYEKEIERIDGD